jgi:hypothetical protein
MHIFSDTQTGGIVDIVVEKSPDIGGKISIIGNLQDDVEIDARPFIKMPY